MVHLTVDVVVHLMVLDGGLDGRLDGGFDGELDG